ncbi:DUF2267 domain-containing protein [Streptomyces sp. NPDC059881]|uniref:DUF2267 domain-containing protein n=1 Tax=Streptomyces sp. NPDC059881 TaxID=3346986 RepID=UPI0036573C4E
MRYDEFLARIRERGEYPGQEEAAAIAHAVLAVLAERLAPGEADDLAAQLPGRLAETVHAARDQRAERFGIEEFYGRVSKRLGPRPRTAEWDAKAVLTTLAETVSLGELEHILTQLPEDFGALFGRSPGD